MVLLLILFLAAQVQGLSKDIGTVHTREWLTEIKPSWNDI